MKQSGYYSYIKPNTDIKTKYQIEFTRNQKIFDIMDTSKFTFDMLNKIEFDYLQDAINTYNVLYYDESVLHVMLFEQIILNDEVILEQCKDNTSISILPRSVQNRVNQIELENEEYKKDKEQMKAFIKKYKAEDIYKKFIEDSQKQEQ
jgi:hypothetical protein